MILIIAIHATTEKLYKSYFRVLNFITVFFIEFLRVFYASKNLHKTPKSVVKTYKIYHDLKF